MQSVDMGKSLPGNNCLQSAIRKARKFFGSNLAKENQSIRRIVVKSDEGVFSVMGPLSE